MRRAGLEPATSSSDIIQGEWPCNDVLWLAKPFAGRPGWQVTWTILTASDPEPGLGVTVLDDCGYRWRRTDSESDQGSANWEKIDATDFDPESWTKVAGNYGPVKVVKVYG